MKRQLEQVLEFHKAFNIPVLSEGEQPTQERIDLRKKLILEEFKELEEAHESGNIEHIAKEACDLVYVCLGTVLEFGWKNHKHLAALRYGIGYSPESIKSTKKIERCVQEFLSRGSMLNLDSIVAYLDDYLNITPAIFERCFDEVHRSNMSKLDANGKPIYRADGKVLKSELYSHADLSFLSQK